TIRNVVEINGVDAASPRSKRSQFYINPVQAGCADPVVLRHGGMYYAYSTHSPDSPDMVHGIRMHLSKDLVHWEDQGYVLKAKDSWGNSRFWAPDIVERDGKFYLYYAADTRICVATADSPSGPFRQRNQRPMNPESLRIDAHVFKDSDGQYYLYYVDFNHGNEIWGGRLNDDMMTVDADSLKRMVLPDQSWEKHRGNIVEGPEMLKHNGVYYLTYSGSHFESREYAVGYATSGSPLGPWEKYERNPIMKSTSYAHGTAHHCFTESPDGSELFIVYHRHHSLTQTEPRQLSIDRALFVSQGQGPDVLQVHGPTLSPQPIPACAEE
ncbi:glycoside hydrolase family 43 protein, partial [Rubripirellula sp.]